MLKFVATVTPPTGFNLTTPANTTVSASRWLTPNTIADANGDAKSDLSDLSILANGWLRNF